MFPLQPILTVSLIALNTPPFFGFKPKVEPFTRKEPTLGDRMDCINTVTQLLAQIIAGGKLIPRIEKHIFPGMTDPLG